MNDAIPVPAAPVVDEAAGAALSRSIIERLFVLSRVVLMHGPRHPLVDQTVAGLAHSMAAAAPPYALQFVGQGVFRDRVLVPMDAENFTRGKHLAAVLSNLGVHEMAVDSAPTAETLATLGVVLARGAQGPSDDLERAHLPGIRFREIPAARWGTDSTRVDPEMFTIAQVALAIHDAEVIFAKREGPWPWSAGVGLLRRLERAMEASAPATMRALDTAPGEWTIARRALVACHHVMTALTELKVVASTRRAIGHAAVVIAMHGLEDRDGADFQVAAHTAMRKMLDAALPARTGVEPHRLRTLALVHGICTRADDPANWTGAMALIELAYALERHHCPRGVDFVLARVDLLAHAASGMESDFDARWVRSLVTQCGQIPPGATVLLADGRVGMALEPGDEGDPMRPKVLVDGETIEPAQAVRLVPTVH
jgi:hypothetical protein